MSWQAGAILILLAVLVGGFAWYERSRPASRIVALVAVLAALAVAGRVVLAPIPNVAATTDIALLAGYSLGAAPGFAVGALSAVVSNFWLGQGPWTLWQMIAWGSIGIGGAALAWITVRRLGRVGLAIAAALAGLAYGAFLDFSVMVNFGGEQSLDRYLALSARGLPFNIAHALGNAALMFAAGPALVAMLARFRERAEFRWDDRDPGSPERSSPNARPQGGPGRRPGARTAGAAGLVFLCLALIGTSPAADADAAVTEGAAWLERAQNDDGGFGATRAEDSNVALTGWAALGLEASEHNPLDVGDPNPVDYLRANAGELRSTGDLERTMLVLAGAGVDARTLGGQDLFKSLSERRRANGSWEGQVNLTAFGILAQRAAGRSASQVRASARWLRNAQNEDGGWGSRADAISEPDSTGAVMQALAVSPAELGEAANAKAAQYLDGAQEADGGWALTPGSGSNSQSTAWAAQGLESVGVNPDSVRNGGKSGFDYLDARQAPNGRYRYSRDSDQTPVWVTAQALLALERQPFPIAAVEREPAEDEGGSNNGSPDGTGDSQGGGSGGGGDGSSGQNQGGDGEGAGGNDGGAGTDGNGNGAQENSSGKSGSGGSEPNGDQGGGAENGSSRGEPAGGNQASGAQDRAARAQASNDESDDMRRRLILSGIAVLLAGLLAGGFRYWRRPA